MEPRRGVTLLQTYFLAQTRRPLILSLAALTSLAILTQSLQTLDLIVENKQSGLTFLKITFLALPQLVAIILPLSVFMATLYAINRLNMDSELVVAKAAGVSPWKIAKPIIYLSVYAMIAHIIINLILQPYSFRQMRAEVFKVRTDIIAQMVVEGEFISPLQGLTVYARRVETNGRLTDVIIYDARNADLPNNTAITQTAQSGEIQRADEKIALRLRNGAVQKLLPDGSLDIVEFEDYIVDLTELTRTDQILRLKASDRYIHELFKPNLNPNSGDTQYNRRKNEYLAEAHARLSTPLYSPALALLALCFLVRGPHQRMGYVRKITLCAGLGFILRLSGFGLTSTAEANPYLNIVQYGLPLGIIFICIIYLLNPHKVGRSNALSANTSS